MQEMSRGMRSWWAVGISLVALVAVGNRHIPGLHSSSVPLQHPAVTAIAFNFSNKADTILQKQYQNPSGNTSVLAHVASPEGNLRSRQLAQISQLGGTIYRRLPIIDNVAISLPTKNLGKLANLPFIVHLSSDVHVRKADEFITEATGAVIANTQYGLTGTGIGVAVVDSGIDKREDLKLPDGSTTRIIATQDYVTPSNNTPTDPCGHGTHVAGIIGGNGLKSTGPEFTRTFYGIARNVNLINVRVLDEQGGGAVSDVISAMDWIIKKQAKYNIRVVNLSLGHPVAEPSTTDPLCQAVEKVWKSGIVVVTAAGNFGRSAATATIGDPNEGYGTNYGSIQSPANDPYVITVGATKPFNTASNLYDPTQHAYDTIATYSSRGPSVGELTLKPDIIAPGNRVISLRPKDGYLPTIFPDNQVYKSWYIARATGNARSNQYYILSGTSMASPVVAGAAALLLQQNPNLTPDTIKARLMVSADKWTNPDGSTDPFTYGAGYLNIPNALNSTVTVKGYAVSPTLTVNTNGTLVVATSGPYWTKGSLWGSGISNLSTLWGSAFNSPTGLANPGYLWSAANKLQGDIITWGGNDGTNTTTTYGAIITWGGNDGTTNGSIITWGGNDGTTMSTVRGDIITWGGNDGTTNVAVNGEP
jgi:serine protease AprX